MAEILDFIFSPYAESSAADIWIEVIAAVFGLASVYFATKENIWVYPTGIISTALYVYILYNFGLFGDMGINAYYFAMSIYGWYMWSRPDEEKVQLPISSHTKRERMISVVLLLVFFVILALFLKNFTPSTVPYIDALTTSIFFVGMWDMARKKLENWVFWIIGDVITVPLYLYKGLAISSLQYLVFTLLAIKGYRDWKKKLEAEKLMASSEL